ncbi:MAG: quinone oxidoreductase [Rickettsiales bacterium]|nr:quinone oxidoreductase [Rickettsiales bacterium]
MSKAMVIHQPGGPEELKWEDVPIPEPGDGEILIKQLAVGMNYIDVLHRSGVIPVGEFPATIGVEGAGLIVKVGPNCEFGFKEGDRVCYAGGPIGAYSQYRTIPERWLIRIPEKMSKELAASVMVKGLTSYYLTRRTFRVDEHTTMLVHAAAGGVGSFLCQWGKLSGATVIGTVGSSEKAQLAEECGCTHIINYQKEDVVARVREITNNVGCNVVYDSVGMATFEASMQCLMPFGLLVSYGEASGPIPPVELGMLQKHGSIFVTRPSFEDYVANHAEYVVGCSDLMNAIIKGGMRIHVKQSYYLRDAARAHKELAGRQTMGASIFYTEVE